MWTLGEWRLGVGAAAELVGSSGSPPDSVEPSEPQPASSKEVAARLTTADRHRAAARTSLPTSHGGRVASDSWDMSFSFG